MKRYWLFQCNDYEASGGLHDLDAIGDDVEELKGNAKEWDNAWVLDTETWTTIWKGFRDWSAKDRRTYVWEEINEPVKLLQEDK